MAFASDKGRQGAAGVSTGYDIDNSLRFNDDDSAYLSRTETTAGDRKTWTWSAWVKRGNLGMNQSLFGAVYSGAANYALTFRFSSSDKLDLSTWAGPQLLSKAVFRDPSAWMHIVLRYDTTQATESDRVRMYVNGEVLSLDEQSYGDWYGYPNQNDATRAINGGYATIAISTRNPYGNDNKFDGLLSEVHFVDGTSLDPTSFGETGDYGEWKAKKVSGLTYGTNGFHLDFKTSGTLGNDANGSNNWTTNNLASTDQMVDTPTNNFCTLNPLDYHKSSSAAPSYWSEGNLKYTHSYNYDTIAGTLGASSGKWYFEYTNLGSTNTQWVGFANTGMDMGDGDSYRAFSNTSSWTYSSYLGQKWNGDGMWNATSYGESAWASGSIIGCAIDIDAGKIWWSFNNTWQASGNPVTGANAAFTTLPAGHYRPLLTMYNAPYVANFGQDSSFAGNKTAQGNQDGNEIGDFYYTPPSGFLALCTKNLPDPAVIPSEHFNTVLYTGTGTTNVISLDGMTAADMWWDKYTGGTGAHQIFDRVRGLDKVMFPNLTNGDQTISGTAYSSSGGNITYTGTHNGNNLNGNLNVIWAWKANGAGVSNDEGNLTTSISANVDAGFSAFTYTGVIASGNTLGHGLDKAPEMILIKVRSTYGGWVVYHKGIASDAETDMISLEQSAAASDSANIWNDTAPSNTVITLGNNGAVSTTQNYLGYAFHSVDGFSLISSYIGNGSSDGSFIWCGFRPAFVMLKRSDSSGNWNTFDNARDIDNPTQYNLSSNNSSGNAADGDIDMVSNGFKIRNSDALFNTNGGNYIFYAIAESPFKHTNAR